MPDKVHISTCLIVYRSICLYLPYIFSLSIFLSIQCFSHPLSVYCSVCVLTPVFLSVCLYTYLSVFLQVSPSSNSYYLQAHLSPPRRILFSSSCVLIIIMISDPSSCIYPYIIICIIQISNMILLISPVMKMVLRMCPIQINLFSQMAKVLSQLSSLLRV